MLFEEKGSGMTIVKKSERSLVFGHESANFVSESCGTFITDDGLVL